MAKVSFQKLTPVKQAEIKTITFRDETVEVKAFVPFAEKLIEIANIIERCTDTNTGFLNEAAANMEAWVSLMKLYTNINFTEKQLSDVSKVYDLLLLNDILIPVKAAIGEDAQRFFDILQISIESTNKYRLSFLGIMQSIGQDYSNLDLQATEIQEKLKDPESLKLLKDILPLTGLGPNK